MNRLLLVGRQDYVVRSLRVDTQAETWNATFARMNLISPGVAAAGVRSFLAGAGGGGGALGLPLGSWPTGAPGAWDAVWS